MHGDGERPFVAAIVVAGGSGSRFGAKKQFAELPDGTVLERSCRTAASVADQLVVVVPSADVADIEIPGAVCVAGGDTRAQSVRSGLAAVSPDAAIVAVHDAARPLATPALWNAVIDAVLDGAAGAIPGLASTDTLKEVQGPPDRRTVSHTVDRDMVVRVQTPQAFSAEALRQAHAAGLEATDDASLLEHLGAEVVVVPGEPTNLKITDPDDLETARRIIGARADRPGRSTLAVINDAESSAPMSDHASEVDDARRGVAPPAVRVGLGYDIHPFGSSAPLVLGGVRIDGQGLAGHSDADAVAHAVADALLGAAGLGDIGSMFPASEDRWAGADSMMLLAIVVERVSNAGWAISNLDVVINAERPKLSPHLDAMRSNLATALEPLGASPEHVNLKPKRGEGLGAVGRGEGIACWANVALMTRPEPA